MSLEGMPYSYNKAVLDHPDMREFVEKVWGASCRKDARIAELEAALRKIAGLPTREANGQKDRASLDVLTGGDAINIARAALSTKEAEK